MRVLFSTTAGDGHFGPMKPLARACLDAGHEVRVAAPESFASAVGRAGFTHAPFPDAPADLMGRVFAGIPSMSMEDANATVMKVVFGRLDAQAALPGLRSVVEEWGPDVVLRDPAEFASLAVAEAAGIPYAEVAIGLAAMMAWAQPHLDEPLAELGTLVGLADGRLVTGVAGAPVFTMVPEGLEYPRTSPHAARRTIRYRVDRSGAGGLPPAWGDPTHPLVYVTFGTVAGGLDDGAATFAAALDALADLPVRVLLTTGYAQGAEAPGTLPANAHVERFWPQDDVMPHAAVVVGHGGFGTTMSALAAGVPQVVVPLFSTDQELNARRIDEVGAGLRLEGGAAGVSRLAGPVARLLDDDGFRSRSGVLAAEIATLPDPGRLVEDIERLAARG